MHRLLIPAKRRFLCFFNQYPWYNRDREAAISTGDVHSLFIPILFLFLLADTMDSPVCTSTVCPSDECSESFFKMMTLMKVCADLQSFINKHEKLDADIIIASDEFQAIVPMVLENITKTRFHEAIMIYNKVTNYLLDQYEKKELEDAKKKGSVVFPTLKSLIGKKKHTTFCRYRMLTHLQRKYLYEGTTITSPLGDKAYEFPMTFYMSKSEAEEEGVGAYWNPPLVSVAETVSCGVADASDMEQTD